MKALIKQNSKQFFKKYEKPAESIDKVMNTIQARKIATIVGIDMSQMKEMAWFFQLIAKLKLPSNYTRFLSEDKEHVVYVNTHTHQETTQHPSLQIIKTLFYQTLANNKAVYTFLEKETKLLPFVQEKMLRQCIGLGSKRRDAEKVNLQRDDTGKMVMSKLQRIKPDIKSLLSSRSYMLKMLVQKVFTRKQILGKGKRSAAYANCIAEVKKIMKQSQPQKDEEEFDTEQNIELYQAIFQQAQLYYQLEFGDLNKIPSRVMKSKQYLESTPQNVLKNIFLLNVDKDKIELYWLARMMDCLPLPPNWSKKKGASFDSYIYEPQKLTFDIHPSYIYILNQINKFKGIFSQLGSIRQNYYFNMRQLTFYDFFERAYTVDMYGYIDSFAKKSNKIKSKDRRTLRNQQNSDWMVLEGMRNTSITPRNYILIQYIEKYWSSLDFASEPWCPSISPFGEVVWSSNINEKSMSFNPYKPMLSRIIEKQTEQLPKITYKVLKKDYYIYADDSPSEQLNEELNQQAEELYSFDVNVHQLIEERQNFLYYYLAHEDKAVPWPYQLKNKFQAIDEGIYYDQIFTSPFQLDKDIVKEAEEVPFWLQKCRAKQHTIDNINLLLFNPQNFTEIKQKISTYAMTMMGEHEPYLSQQTEKKLNRISNSEQLIRFLNYINDLDMRQQRKKQYQQSLIQLQSDSDIFGSQISQVEVNEEMDEQEQIAQEKESVDSKSVTEKESIKEESEEEQLSQKSEPEEIVYEQEQKQPEPPREEYQFLKNFPKKKYQKILALQNKQEQELRQILKEEASKKKRKCKYKQGIIRKKVQREIELFNRLSQPKSSSPHKFYPYQHHKNQLSTKRNMIITHLRHHFVPYTNNKQQFVKIFDCPQEYKVSQRQSEMNYSEITSYQDFKSEIGDYETNEIEELIIEEKAKQRQRMKIRTPSEVHHQIEHEVTKDTIELQPIYQIKPNIHCDPVLRHVKGLAGDLSEFRKTFNQSSVKKKHELEEQSQRQSLEYESIVSRSKSLKNVKNTQTNYHSTPAPQVRSGSVNKVDRLALQSKLSLTKREGFGSVPRIDPKPFHRVCLDSTASHFLGKQAFLRKGDIITMQARKTLLSKGRGLETYISKFY